MGWENEMNRLATYEPVKHGWQLRFRPCIEVDLVRYVHNDEMGSARKARTQAQNIIDAGADLSDRAFLHYIQDHGYR